MVGREDIYNLLLLICYKGGALWDITQQYTRYQCWFIDYYVIGVGGSAMLVRVCFVSF